MKKTLLCLGLLLFIITGLQAQNTFEGTFTMELVMAKHPTMVSTTRFSVKNENTLLSMTVPGLERPFLTMLIDSKAKASYMLFENVEDGKTAYKTDLKDSKNQDPEIKETSEKKVIDGYNCRKLIIKTAEETSEVWVTDDVPINFADISKTLSSQKSSGGMPGGFKGFPIKMHINSIKKGEIDIAFKNVKKEPVDSKIFDISSYKISASSR